MKDKSYILYIGGYLNEQIVEKRNLPTRNPAGSNRMSRIANALQSCDQPTIIVSPGTCLRPRLKSGVFHPYSISRTQSVPVIFSSAIGIPIISSILAFIYLPLTLLGVLKTKNVSAVIIYNFSFLLLIITIWMKLLRIPVFQNIEDVSIPKLNDWLPSQEVRPLQQLIFSCSMKNIARLSNGLVVPSKKFLQYVSNKPSLLVTGCIDLKDRNASTSEKSYNKSKILFAGKIEFEHGIRILVETLFELDNNENAIDSMHIVVCGTGSKQDWLRIQLKKLNNLKVDYLGFVSDEKYRSLLIVSDVCLALQDPVGRYASTKTPSKVYEYLGFGKTVIATDVGDLSEIPDDVLIICSPFTKVQLAKILSGLTANPKLIKKRAKNAAQFSSKNYIYNVVGKRIIQFIEKCS